MFVVVGEEEAKLEILRENFEHCDDDLYISFDSRTEALLFRILPQQISARETVLVNICVEFEVKHSFFNSLIRAVDAIELKIIERILPSKEDFLPFFTITKPELQHYLQLPLSLGMHLDKGQLSALEIILTSNPTSPPVLVSGSFGTGKTQLLAVASHCLIEQGKVRGIPVRVLVCAHHQDTADHLVKQYFGPMLLNQPENFELVRLNSKYSKLPIGSNFKKYCTNNTSIISSLKGSRHLIIATTFLTSLSLKQKVGTDFFTHILLDEGSQTREPEAIAPLRLASPNTKLVIAGDSNQVSQLSYNFPPTQKSCVL